MDKDNQTTQDEIQQAFVNWLNHLANIVAMGRPFFDNEGRFTTEFRTEQEIFNLQISAKLNNVIPFPEKKVLPKRI